jgi:ketosteroid isomerase-like protein
MYRSVVALAALLVIPVADPQDAPSPALRALVETERAFAGTATVKGLRDSFLDFFAEDSIALTPGPTSARDRLRRQPSQPFSVLEITWEPRTGDIAASNDIGWLTGPSTIINHSAPQPAPHYGNYLSVWRRQPDGNWRVYIDVGVNVPELPPFAPGFTRTPFADRYKGNEGKEAATRSLLAADRALNARVVAAGPSAAYAERTTDASRLHRAGFIPLSGTQAISAWLAKYAPSMTAVSTTAEAAQAGDLGFSYGSYDVKGAPPEAGAYVRVWMRDAGGRWFVVADVTQPAE